MVLHGTPVSRGIAIGPACVFQSVAPEVCQTLLRADEVDGALQRFAELQQTAKAQLRQLQEDFSAKDTEQAMIFAAHQDILSDETIEEMICDNVREKLFQLDYAIASAFDYYAALLSRSKDERIRQRSADVVDVKNRLLRILRGDADANLDRLTEPCILVMQELLPSDAAKLDQSLVLGIVTQAGNATSHAAILANTLAIPAVLGVPGLMDAVKTGQAMVLDALNGAVILEPQQEQLAEFMEKRNSFIEQTRLNEAYRCRAGATADGTPISIGLNIGAPEDIQVGNCFDFVGLFRSEFLYMGTDHLPTEEEQYRAYRQALSNVREPVTLRTLDIGGDKELPYLQMQPEQNPFLGLRALRYCFTRPDIFRTQLRAALRASVHGELWLMFPMVTALEDIRRAREAVNKTCCELRQEGSAYAENIKIGVMIEVPAAAMLADRIAEEVDFASVGTNDLCQYMMAADRGNSSVADYYQSLHPGFLRMLRHVLRAFCEQNKPISICGELAGDPVAAPLLVGLGARKLSMSAGRIPAVKRALASHTIEQMSQLAERALELGTDAQVRQLAESF